jgi:hypothetical protein
MWTNFWETALVLHDFSSLCLGVKSCGKLPSRLQSFPLSSTLWHLRLRFRLLCFEICGISLTFWHRSFTFNSNKSPTWCNNFLVYYPDVCLQLNMFRAFSRPSSGAQWLQWQPLVLTSYRGDSRVVFVVGPAGRPEHEHSTAITTIRR